MGDFFGKISFFGAQNKSPQLQPTQTNKQDGPPALVDTIPMLKDLTEEKLYRFAKSLQLKLANGEVQEMGFTLCFTGKEGIDAIQHVSKVKTKQAAMEVAQLFMDKGKILLL